MQITISGDHRGHDAVEGVIKHLNTLGHDVVVQGACDGGACDYPVRSLAVAQDVAEGRSGLGVLICGSGIGVSIAANKVNGVRAALVVDAAHAQGAREHNHANVLCFAADRTSVDVMCEAVDAWMHAEPKPDRHARRVEQMAEIERGSSPQDQASSSA